MVIVLRIIVSSKVETYFNFKWYGGFFISLFRGYTAGMKNIKTFKQFSVPWLVMCPYYPGLLVLY